MKPKYKKLEDSSIWKNVYEIAQQVHTDTEGLSEDYKYPYGYDLSSDIASAAKNAAEAAGGLDPRDQTWQLGIVRSKLFAVKSTLKFVYGLKILGVNPELMVLIDETIKLLDAEVTVLPTELKQWQKSFELPARSDK